MKGNPATHAAEQETIRAINEALVLGSVRQHAHAAAAQAANVQLQEEIKERKLSETALHRIQVQLTDHAGELEGLVSERTAELTAMNRQLEAFVYSIAHDLRAPLRAMQGFSELLIEEAGDALNLTSRGYAYRIKQSAQFMDALLCDLLAFSRVSQQRVELTVVNLSAIVESASAVLRKELEDKGAVVEGMGPWPAVVAHPSTLTQVLINLMSNAMKFARPGVPARIKVWAQERAERVRVWVEDNGVGIAPEYHEQIFRLFTRLHGEKYPGTGLGLAIVQKSLERMGGQVGIESAPLAGSRFWFELPKGEKKIP